MEPTYQAKVEKEEKEERVREAKEKERAREKANVPRLDESWDNKLDKHEVSCLLLIFHRKGAWDWCFCSCCLAFDSFTRSL